eukprot:10970108-Lingulodinium_polyedra.AAC.1
MELCEKAKKKSAKELAGLLAFMEKSVPTAVVERFPRGVAWLGETAGSRYIPTYAVELCLAKATDLSEHFIRTMDDVERRLVWLHGIKAMPQAKVPEPEMAKSAFYAWYAKEHARVGKPLAQAAQAGIFNWNLTVGFFRWHKSDTSLGHYDEILNINDQRTVKLPNNRIAACDKVPIDWFFEDNWCFEKAELHYLPEVVEWKCHKLFQLKKLFECLLIDDVCLPTEAAAKTPGGAALAAPPVPDVAHAANPEVPAGSSDPLKHSLPLTGAVNIEI